jgi:anti-sigma-K factor RskA
MDANDLHDLTAPYALDALEPNEARAYEDHLSGCERCREELGWLQQTATVLAHAAEPVTPPDALRGRILAAARAERPNVVPLRPGHWASRPLAAVAAIAACAAVGLGIWNISLHHDLGQERAALRGVQITGATGSVVVSGSNAALVLADLSPAPVGKTYEAWVIAGGKAYPAGLFGGGQHTIVFKLTRALPAGAVVAVTLEPAGGTQQPTAKPLITSQPV